jgi:hypothetical protein
MEAGNSARVLPTEVMQATTGTSEIPENSRSNDSNSMIIIS